MHSLPQHLLKSSIIGLAAVLLLSGCGDKKSDEKKAATQVAAKVNKEEISVHQINNVLARAGNVSPEQSKAASKQILDKLIDQELLVQQATEKKLDRDPRVLQAIEASKREILARAYLEQVAGNAAKPDDAAIKDFYDKNPALFKERRIFNLQELVIAAKPDQVPAIQERVKVAKGLDEVVNWLKEQKIPFNGNAGVKSAEQLPLEMLPRFQELKDGQTALITTPAGLTLVFLAGSQTRPLDEAAAKPFIEQFLLNQKRNDIAQSEVKQLRAKAKIEYVGDFAKSAGEAAPVSPAAEAPAPAAPAQPAPAPAKGDAVLEKGISGLK